MSSASQTALNAPPLPRYRFHHATGTWRAERVRHHDNDGAAHAGGAGRNGHSSSTTAPTAAAAAPFESTYDFQLRSVKPPTSKRSAADRQTRQREGTAAAIRSFEATLFKQQSAALAGRRVRSASDSRKRSSASLRARKSVEELTTTTAVAAAPALHPLVGYASMTSMPHIYAALAALYDHPLTLAPSSSGSGSGDRLRREDFYDFVDAIGPAAVLSTSYEQTMFTRLPTFDAETESVDVVAVLTLLLNHRYHPQFDANVAAFFRAFDVDNRGVVAREALQPNAVVAWAAGHTFGNLRDQWLRFAAVLAEAMTVAPDTLPLVPELVPVDVVRAFLCCSETLYTAACTLDLDGGSL